MKISSHQILAFAAVGREKSFIKAANKLGIGQSAITQHVKGLEEQLGGRLFNRSRVGTELTGLGQSLFPLADRIRILEEQFVEKALQINDL